MRLAKPSIIPIAIEDAACPPGGELHETGEVLMGLESEFLEMIEENSQVKSE